MEFFCYHRDRPGSMQLRRQMVERHWSYMDRFAAQMIARGPTFEEPGYQAGAYRDVMLRRWRNTLGRSMYEYTGDRTGAGYYLVLGFTAQPSPDAAELPSGDELIACGPLLSDDGTVVLGAALLVEAPGPEAARATLPADHATGAEVHRWRFGGRPA